MGKRHAPTSNMSDTIEDNLHDLLILSAFVHDVKDAQSWKNFPYLNRIKTNGGMYAVRQFCIDSLGVINSAFDDEEFSQDMLSIFYDSFTWDVEGAYFLVEQMAHKMLEVEDVKTLIALAVSSNSIDIEDIKTDFVDATDKLLIGHEDDFINRASFILDLEGFK